MSSRYLVICLGLGLSGGCETGRPSADASFFHIWVRNSVEAPAQFVNEQCFKVKAWVRARDAWSEFTGHCPNKAFSTDFHDGFLEGFIDYLDAGGTGNPPAVPPARYWTTGYESPEGVAAIHDWFDGFRHGAEAARASGLRDTIIVPLSTVVGTTTNNYTTAQPVTPTSTPTPALEAPPVPRAAPLNETKGIALPNR